MSSKLFEKLLQNSKTLVGSPDNSDSSKLERELGQIASESFLLKSKFNTDQGLDATAHYFLAQSGTNTQEIIENLNAIDTKVTFQPRKKVPNNDVESYLNQVHKDIVIATVQESNHNTRTKLLDRLDDNLHSDWKEAQRQILEEWDYEQEDKKFGRQTEGKDKQLESFKKKMLSYASTVKELNKNRLLSEKTPIIKTFKSLSGLTKCDKAQERAMIDSWDIVSNIANESRENGHRIEGGYTNNYNDKYAIVKMNRRLIDSAKSWLENEYTLFISNTLNNNAAEAKVGGSPSLKHRIYAFMKLIFMKNSNWVDPTLEIEENYPIWLYLYLLIRSGHPDLALEFVNQNVHSFYKSPDFPAYLKEYLSSPQKIVSEDTRKIILQNYQEMEYGNSRYDPYKILLYKIIGRCEVEKMGIPIVIKTTEDYMWLELSLIRDNVNEESYSSERFRLSDFQQKIASCGPMHFDPHGNNPWFYFKILLLSLQFERAIDYLYKSEEFRLEAVHFGIALAYYGLIRIPTDPRSNTLDLLITEWDSSVSLNFGRLISQYVRLFVSDTLDDALQYLYLITLYPTEDMMIICREQIFNYAVSCNDYKKIIGAIDYNYDQTQQGSIVPYKPLIGVDIHDDDIYRDTILIPIAKKFQERGKYADAVNVYELSRKYTEALKVLNRQLDYALVRPIETPKPSEIVEGHQTDQQLIDFCILTLRNYENRTDVTCNAEVLSIHRILLSLLRATLQYEQGQYEQSVEIIKSTNILPESSDYNDVQLAAFRFDKYTDYIIRKHVHQILVMVMESYSKLCEEYSKHNLNLYTVHQSKIAKIKNDAAAIMAFVGLIEYKIPADIIVKLNKQDLLSKFN